MRAIWAVVFVLGVQMGARADVTEHCDGKYLQAAELVDAAYSKYGTLYSGGHHQHRTDNVGATLDLYRFWRGLPDVGLRGAEVVGTRRAYDSAENYVDNPAASEVWARARWAAEAEAPPEGEALASAFAAYGFDRLTGIKEPIDGWRRGAPEPQEDGEGWPRAVELMAEHAALDWMQSVAVASSAEYALYWHLEPMMTVENRLAHGRIAAEDWARYQAGDGIEWAVSAALHVVSEDLEGLGETFAGWAEGVGNCEASAQEYAALASAQAVLGRFRAHTIRRPRRQGEVDVLAQMPPGIRSTINQNRFRRSLLNLPRRCAQDDDDPLAETAPVERVMLRLYAACEIDDVPLSRSAYAFRAYNLLSADHLAELGRREGAPAGLLRAAFARHVALGNWQAAEALLEELKSASHESAEQIDAEWRASGRPKPVRLARIILFTPNLSTMVASVEDSEAGMHLHVWNALGGVDESGSVRGTRNLTPDYFYEDILQRDYEVMLGLPHRWGRFFGRRGFGNTPIGRASRRRARYNLHGNDGRQSEVIGWRRVGRPGGRSGVPFIRNLTDPAELAALSGDAALMRTVSDIIVDWSDAQTRGAWARRFGNHEEDAEALAQLIELCRYNDCGAHAGTPQSERAFRLLKLRMGRTEAARETKYWWVPKRAFR